MRCCPAELSPPCRTAPQRRDTNQPRNTSFVHRAQAQCRLQLPAKGRARAVLLASISSSCFGHRIVVCLAIVVRRAKGGSVVDVCEIRVHGRLDQHWAASFYGLALTYEGGCTVLRGSLMDETALYGVLAKVRDLNVRLLAVHVIEGDGPTSAPAGS